MPSQVGAISKTPVQRLELKTATSDAEKAVAKQAFLVHKNAYGKCDPAKVPLVIKHLTDTDNDFDEIDQKRVTQMVFRICDPKQGVSFDQLWRLCKGQVDVLMLSKLFHEHNISEEAKEDPFVDYEDVTQIMHKLFFPIDDATLRPLYDQADRNNNSFVDWEGFLSLSTKVFGKLLHAESSGGGKSSFNELKANVNRMKALLKTTERVIQKYEAELKEKSEEIGQILGDKTHQDTMKRLQQALDVKDQLEQSLMGMKIKQFSKMKDYLLQLDTEKTDIADKYAEEVRNRNMDRDKVSRIRRTFKNEMKHHFLSFPVLIQTLNFIDEASKQVNVEVDKAMEEHGKMMNISREVGKFEIPLQPSSSADAIAFLRAQRSIIDEISTKMQMMQRERDKYEDMIAEEVAKNKEKRLACVNLNMEITNLEGEQMLQEAKLKDQRIQNMTLVAAVEAHTNDKDSKKVKALKSTEFQFRAEEEEVWTEIRETEEKLKETKRRIQVSKKRVSRLNIELGELKIILEAIVEQADDVGEETAMAKMMEGLGDEDGEVDMGKELVYTS